MAVNIDMMEYASDEDAQAEYIGNSVANLQCTSEDTIKTQGDYSLKTIGVITDSLDKILKSSVNWANIYTFSTNASATLITNWIGAAISTSPNIPNYINGQPSVVNYNTVFRAKTALTNCTIGANVSFVDNKIADTFNACSNLIGVDAIPNGVTNMAATFRECPKLVNAPTIGANVTTMYKTFYECSSLVNAPTIPANVTTMYETFRSCSNLVNAPTIGANVTNMAYTFKECTSLVNAPTIGANVMNMASTFQSCSNLVNATTIGANVTSMKETFRSCPNLVGNITIVNANVTSFYDCFRDCNASLAKNLRCPAGSATATLAQSVCNGKNGVTVVNY